MELISSHIAFINPALYRRPPTGQFPPTPPWLRQPKSQPSYRGPPTERKKRGRKKVMMFSKATSTLCLRCSYGEARAADELSVLWGWGEMQWKKFCASFCKKLKSVRGSALLCFALCFSKLLLEQGEGKTSKVKRSLCWYVASVKVNRYCPEGVSSFPSCLCTWKHGNHTQRAAGPA